MSSFLCPLKNRTFPEVGVTSSVAKKPAIVAFHSICAIPEAPPFRNTVRRINLTADSGSTADTLRDAGANPEEKARPFSCDNGAGDIMGSLLYCHGSIPLGANQTHTSDRSSTEPTQFSSFQPGQKYCVAFSIFF